MRIWPLPLLIGLLPLTAITACLQLSQAAGHVPDCNPLLQGCTTVSATGRDGTAYFLFKAMMLPSAGLLLVFWPLAALSLRSAGYQVRGDRALIMLGLLSAAMLALYTTYLGSDGATFRTYRRIGASSFLAGTFFCQLLFSSSLAGRPREASARLMLGLVWLQLLLGLISLPFTTLAPPLLKDSAENLIEWWFCLAQVSFFPACAWWLRDRKLSVSGPDHTGQRTT